VCERATSGKWARAVIPAIEHPGRSVALARHAIGWVFFANGAALGSWVPHIPDAKHGLGLGDSVLGLALLGMAAGSLIGLPLSGMLTSRFGSCKTATTAILALLLVTPLPIAAPTLPLFVIALGLLGIANGAVDVAMNAHAVAVEQRFGRPIMSGFHALFSAGGLAGAATAALAMSAGLSPKAHLLVTVAALLFATVTAVTFLLPTVPTAMRTASFRIPRGPLAWLGALTLCALMAEGAMSDWAAVYLRDDLRADAAVAALGFAAFSLAMAIGRFCGDKMVTQYGGPVVLAAGAGIAATLLTASLVIGSPIAALLGFTAVGLGLSNAVPILFSIAGKAPGTSPELAIAAVSIAGYCGFLFGPPVIGLISERLGLGIALGLIALALAAVALGGASLASEGSQRRWMASLNASK
jgi:predicted MFS family arabinose efflux permease